MAPLTICVPILAPLTISLAILAPLTTNWHPEQVRVQALVRIVSIKRKRGKQRASKYPCFPLLTGCDPEQEARSVPMRLFLAVQASNKCGTTCCFAYCKPSNTISTNKWVKQEIRSLSSSGKDIAFSRRRHGFNSRRGYVLFKVSIGTKVIDSQQEAICW